MNAHRKHLFVKQQASYLIFTCFRFSQSIHIKWEQCVQVLQLNSEFIVKMSTLKHS